MMKTNACTECAAFTLGEQWSTSPHNCKTLCDTSKMFSYLCYRTTNFISLELSLPGSHPNLVLSESDKIQVVLSLKNWRIPVNHCMPSAAEERLFRLQGSAQGPLSRQQVFGRSLPCPQRHCLSQQDTGSRRSSDQCCKIKEIWRVDSNCQSCHKHLGAIQPEYILYPLYLLFGTCIIQYFKYKVSFHSWYYFS